MRSLHHTLGGRLARYIPAGIFALFALCILASPAAASTHSLRPKIVGGAPIPANQAPWLAFVTFSESGSVYVCTGTVVSPNVVMTAGHCTEDADGQLNDPSSYTVLTGTTTIGQGGQVSGVSKLVVNPGYQANAQVDRDDVALLQLTRPTSAPTVALAPADDSALIVPGHGMVIEGWGETVGGDPESGPVQAQAATTTTQSAGWCEEAFGVLGFDPSAQLCTLDAPSFTSSICFGDSGGPLLANDLVGQSGRPTEIGVADEVSSASCDPTTPDVFARVGGSISTWARTQIARLKPPSRAVPRAEAGSYRGRTGQSGALTLRVTGARRQSITALRFAFTLRCTRGRHHRRLRYGIGPVRRSYGISSGLHFSARFADSQRTHYRITGTLTRAGRASGRLSVRWRTRHYGLCVAGNVRWHAHVLHPQGG